ncbi:MAG: hypothetical protein CR993_00740 [Rhodobacterales bacterium]|nr:MAG: hypothetical protein CR993_00740 [Rhodobacterales bacterium]
MIQNGVRMFFRLKMPRGVRSAVRTALWALVLSAAGGGALAAAAGPDGAILIQSDRGGATMIANRKPDVPQALADELDDLLGRAGEADRAGDGALSMQLMEQAWSLLPEPKTEWNYFPQIIARSTVEAIPEIGQCDGLDPWLERMFLTYFDPKRRDPYTNMVAGHTLFQCGRQEEAVAMFRQVLKTGGPEHFSGQYRPYLELVGGEGLAAPALDEKVSERIDLLAEKGNALLDEQGDWRGAIEVWQTALELLPAPQAQWPEAVWLQASIGAAWLEGGERRRAFQAFEAAYRAENGHLNPFVLLNLGSLLRGQDDAAAVQLLIRAYMLEGPEIFAGGNEDDLAFLAARVNLSGEKR